VGIEVEEAHSEDEVMEAHARATTQWIATNAQATDLHLTNVDEIIQRTADERGISYESARTHIYNVEVSKAKHQKHEGPAQRTTEDGQSTTTPLGEHRLAQPHSENIDLWIEIHEEQMVNDILLQFTKHSLLASAHSPFAHGPLADLVGEDTETDEADEIINGTFDMIKIEAMDIPDKEESVAFLEALQRPTSHDGAPMPDCDCSISATDYMHIFSKTPEKISCGVTMSHWKAA